ncbi:MAG: pilin [Patescibacteria group bacterium]
MKVKKDKIWLAVIFISILWGVLVVGPIVAEAEVATPAEHDPLTLQIPLGAGKEVLQYPYFPQYLEWLFEYFVGITAILAAIGLMWGGYKWIAASGNPGMITSAKGSIMNAAVGLVIALTSWLLLNTLNPRITSLEFPQIISPGVLSDALSCAGKDYPLTGADGKCLPANQIPPLKLCRVEGEDPVYGALKYTKKPWETVCGTTNKGDACLPLIKDGKATGNQFGTACADGSKNVCFIQGMDSSQNGYFSCVDTVQLNEALANGFSESSFTGGDGAEGFNLAEPKMYCGSLWWEKGVTDGDGFFGTAAYSAMWGRDRSACVINMAAGVQWKINYADCNLNLIKHWCMIGCWNEAWIIDEYGQKQNRGCSYWY